MPLSDRDYVRGNHPPTCTCVDCCEKRFKQLKKEVHPDYVSRCPKCGQNSLWHNLKEQKYECLNLKCKAAGNNPSEIGKQDTNSESDEKQKKITRKPTTPNWLLALILIFTLSLIGLVLSTLVGNLIPFWILFGFAVIFSIEKWFNYDTRKHKTLGKLYRLILNLSILSLLGLIIWSGINLFSHHFLSSAFKGSILFIVEFALFIWAWRIVAKNSWRWPSIKLTIFILICLFVIFAFAGVQPLVGYKDTAISKIKTAFSSENNGQAATTYSSTSLAATTAAPNITISPNRTTISAQNVAEGISPNTGTYGNYYLGLATDSSGEILGGDGCYDDTGDFIVLINSKNATNPTYAQLVSFLQSDTTDEYPYQYTNLSPGSYYGTAESHVDLIRIKNIIDGTVQPNPPDVCGDFAERLHNNAEMAGIRCAYVAIDLSGYTDPNNYGIGSNTGHALDAFQTTDRGLVYVDDTGIPVSSSGSSRCVKTVNVVVGEPYVPVSLFPETGWNSTWESMGTVTDIQITWDGTWH